MAEKFTRTHEKEKRHKCKLAGCDKETLITIRRGKERGAAAASSL